MSLSAAAVALAITIFIAGLFAAAFGIIAFHHRPAPGAAWLSAGYGTGMLAPLLEFALPYQSDHRLVSFAIFTILLWALAAFVIGLAHHYRLQRPWRLLAVLTIGAMLTNLFVLEMPRDSLLRGFLYQGPYMLLQALGVFTLLGNRNWRALDLGLLATLVVSSLHFLFKPILAHLMGSGVAPQSYLATNYAAYSQSLGAMLVVTSGLMMLLIILRDRTADMTARSQTDALTGLLNRRGFEDRADKAILETTRTGCTATMIVADIDRLRSINERFGDTGGDRAIMAFAGLLQDGGEPNAIAGRMSGEDFAILLPGANPMTGKLYSETVRVAFAGLKAASHGLDSQTSASFGIASLRPGDTLSDLLRRAEIALYQAKTEGGNRACLFM